MIDFIDRISVFLGADIKDFLHSPWQRAYQYGNFLRAINWLVMTNASVAFATFKNFTKDPSCHTWVLPDCIPTLIWTWCSLIAPLLFFVDWQRPWCQTRFGKACLYFNIPASSTLFVLALPGLLPSVVQAHVNRSYVMWWQIFSLCLLAPLGLWWEDWAGKEVKRLPRNVDDLRKGYGGNEKIPLQ